MLRKVLFVVLLLALLAPAYAVIQTPLPVRVAGQISAINADLQTITVKTTANNVTFKVVSATKIMKDGAPATFADLTVGLYVVAAVIESPDGLVAQYVNASSGQQLRDAAGIVVGVNLELKKVAIKTPTGQEMVFLTNEKTVILRDNQQVTLDRLQIGDTARVAFFETDAGLLAARIEASSKPLIKTADGKITAIGYDARTFTITNAMGVSLDLKADEKTMVYKNGLAAGFSALVAGDFAKVAFFKNISGDLIAVRIDATSADAVIIRIQGAIAEINADQHVIVVLNPMTGARTRVRVGDATEIIKFGMPVKFDALMVGDRVEVSFYRPADATLLPVALRIAVAPSEFSGRISAIDLLAHTVTISRDTASLTVKVVEKTIIMRNGARVPLSALRLGDTAMTNFFNFPDGAVAARIMAKGL